MKGLTTRFLAILSVALFSIYLLIPSILKFGFGIYVPSVVKDSDPWLYNLLPSEVLKLGLDLSGGLHIVLGIDFDEVERDATTKLKTQLSDLAKYEKVEGLTFETTPQNTVIISYATDEAWKKFDSLIGSRFRQEIDFVEQNQKAATIRMSTLYEKHVQDQAIDQALETLRNRIDEFGIAEPIVTKQGVDKILIQFPGVQKHEVERIKSIISRTAKLSFQVVRSGPEVPEGLSRPADDKKVPRHEELKQWTGEFEKAKNMKPNPNEPMSVYLREFNKFFEEKLPKGTELLFHKEINVNTREPEYIPYLLDREPIVTGEDLQDAVQSFDNQTNQPEVNFELTPLGAGKFETGTGANVNQFMAIVLDSNVHSAPRIKQKIGGGRARIEMGSVGRSTEDVTRDARDTALVLRSGALPARLLFLQERSIGPSLGAEAIRVGTLSLSLGLAAVFIFMIIYYRLSGFVAGLALVFNGLLVFSILAAFEGTLTLPGLAGLALTLGMAVDANVLIFEHMREELRNGKSVNMSIAEGYSRAFSAIMDGNITTLVAAFILLQFGYGPIRGFAVTLVIGITASLFTAIFVTRLVFDYFVVSKNRKTISL